MPQSLTRNLVHLIYSTKERKPYLEGRVQMELFAYQATIFAEWESPAVVIGGTSDHIHTLFVLSKNHALSKVVEQVKKGSSRWIKTQGSFFRDFSWQAGYGAFSVSQSSSEAVQRYIEQQEEKHRVRTFQEELLVFLKRHKIAYDERYLWD